MYLLYKLYVSMIVPFTYVVFTSDVKLMAFTSGTRQRTGGLIPVLATAPSMSSICLPVKVGCLQLSEGCKSVSAGVGRRRGRGTLTFTRANLVSTNNEARFVFVAQSSKCVILRCIVNSRCLGTRYGGCLPSPRVLLVTLVVTGDLNLYICLAIRFTERLEGRLAPVLRTAGRVRGRGLSFTVERSQVLRFRGIISSFSDVQGDLGRSLRRR